MSFSGYIFWHFDHKIAKISAMTVNQVVPDHDKAFACKTTLIVSVVDLENQDQRSFNAI